MRVPPVNVHVAEQVAVHVMPIRIRVVREQADVFVKIERPAQRKIQLLFCVPAHEVPVNLLHRRAGRQAEDEARMGAEFARDDARHQRRGGFLVRLNNDFH